MEDALFDSDCPFASPVSCAQYLEFTGQFAPLHILTYRLPKTDY
jgi:hypothetical protein